ncbi:Na+/H+ antiporter NhaA [Altererythrobacter salegens]|uniref:Na(+)/H(+) antiporter NhaA n=1 Tax=Croceibacterium salegens TaxID=1737568 RepID=A0A6I4SQQ0_9SPHN|nr:Na+/H+ antiporter NhaA [Croceibacterium salegens]MXO58135.1 Na+/H+ antiporter NhaA [Croceibacterium salegens]
MTETSILAQATRPFRALFESDAKEGLLLIVVAVAAMIAANTALAGPYHDLFHSTFTWGPIPKLNTLHLWINDAVMAVFFFVVGLEVKRELMAGDLSDPQTLRLPVMAAFAGMALPALIYILVVGEDPVLDRGWAIPAATDIAFAMGVIGLLGKRVPQSARLFLLTVAIVDDIGAVLIIAFFFTAKIKLLWLFASIAAFAGLVLLNWLHVGKRRAYIALAIVLWFCVLHSGVHATIAGVLAAFTIPMKKDDGEPLLLNLEHALVGWNAYLVVPLFGFANAGVDLRGLGIGALFAPLPLAIAAGLVIGKQAGVFGAVVLAENLGIARRPEGTTWMQVWGLSALCGIGFTMSLFIGTMAFTGYDALYEQAKLGVLTGTFTSLVLGYVILLLAPQGKTEAD